jgi:hypothetical protein
MPKKKVRVKKAKKQALRIKKVKKAVKKKTVKSKAKKSAKIKKQAPELSLEKIGKVTHYFPQVKAAAVMLLKDGLKVGDNIYLKGHTTDFKETVKSIQLDRVAIQEGKKGQEIGLLVKKRVRQGDSVYKI